jgi:hypothetical protein
MLIQFRTDGALNFCVRATATAYTKCIRLHLLHCQIKYPPNQWRTQEFCSVWGVQQIQLRTEVRGNGDLGRGVAP